MIKIQQRSKRLANDICNILDVSPPGARYQEVILAIHAELAPDRQATMKIIRALPKLLADYEQCALGAKGYLNSRRAGSISKIRRQVKAVLTAC
jgi:hypothetical protein